MKNKIIVGLMIILFAIAFGIFIIYRVILVPSGIDIDKTKYPITGIDVSHHTGKIDFQKAKGQNIDFVYMKSTEGEFYKDNMFEKNYKSAKESGIPIGAYHFFRFNKPGKSQVNNFLSSIKGKTFELPFVIDIEDWGNSTSMSKEEIINEIDAFITSFKMETGADLLIYTNENGYNKYIVDSFSNNNIWICSFNKKPHIKGKWTFWQHSHKGKYNFADDLVDVNTFNGNAADWQKYLGK